MPLTVKAIPHTGLTLASSDFAAATDGGDQAPTGSGVVLVARNSDSAAHTVILAVPETVDSLSVDSRSVTVPAGDDAYIPLLPLYNDPATGLASWTYDATPTSVTLAVIRAA